MYSKFLTLIAVLSLVGCSYFFDDKEEKKNSYNLSISEKAGVSCIEGNTQLFKDYFDLKRGDREIEKDLIDMKACVRSAVELFLKHTKGAQGNSYSTMEIHDFLAQAFTSYSYPPGFMDEVVRLKHSLIGGTPYSVTKAELQDLMVYVDFIYENLAVLAKDRHLLFSQRKGDDRAEFLAASARLQVVVRKFTQLKRKDSGIFDYDSLTRLVGYFTEDVRDSSTTWSKTLDLVNSLQAMLTAGRRDNLNIQSFPLAAESLAQMYIGYIEFQKFLQEPTFFKDLSSIFIFPGLITPLIKNHTVYEGRHVVESMNNVQRNIFVPLLNAVHKSPERRISTIYFDDLIDTLLRIGSLSETLSASTLKMMIPEFFGRWLSSGNCGNSCKSTALTAENVNVLLKLVDDWKERQLWVNAVGVRHRNSIRLNSEATVAQSANVMAMKQAMDSITHTHWEDYLVIGSKDFKYKDLVIFNSIYTLTSIFTRPFNENWKKEKTVDYYITQDQTQQLYEWLRELGINLKLVDPRSRNSGRNVFMEGNLFTSIGADADKFDFPEIVEYLGITFTTGNKSVAIMENEFKNCRIQGLVDVFDFPKLDALCFREELHRNYESLFFSTIPRLKEYTKTLSPEGLNELLNSLEKAARQGLIVNEPAETDTMRFVGSIIQYSESLFLRFDADQNNEIDSEEYKKALAHITPNIRKVIRESLPPATASFLYNQFPEFESNLIAYIIRYKTVPAILVAEVKLGQSAGFAALKAFKLWVNSGVPEWMDWLTSKKTTVSRSDILLVISALSTFNRANRIKAMKSVFENNIVAFDNGIKDINDPILEKLSLELQCSTKKTTELKQWLLDRQKDYWVKNREDGFTLSIPFFSSSTINIKHEDVPTSGLWANWSGAVTRKLIELLYKETSLSSLCSLPYVDEIQRVAPEQGPRKASSR
ncbi:MAG: hypothetical protein K2Q26_04820 [Bdellovibrionales bacterium]|nr:hypothetical protein [Bdellovibrionales bacterium]